MYSCLDLFPKGIDELMKGNRTFYFRIDGKTDYFRIERIRRRSIQKLLYKAVVRYGRYYGGNYGTPSGNRGVTCKGEDN